MLLPWYISQQLFTCSLPIKQGSSSGSKNLIMFFQNSVFFFFSFTVAPTAYRAAPSRRALPAPKNWSFQPLSFKTQLLPCQCTSYRSRLAWQVSTSLFKFIYFYIRKVVNLTKEVYSDSNCTVYHTHKIRYPAHFVLIYSIDAKLLKYQS